MTVEEQEAAALKVEDEQIRAGARVKEFLEDPAIATILREIEAKYLAEFVLCDGSTTKLEAAWAKNQALQDFLKSMRALEGSAELARHARDTRPVRATTRK